MDSQAILKRVIEIVSYCSGTDPKLINEKTNLYGDLMIDSLDFQSLVLEIEREFGVSFTEEDMKEANNHVSDVVNVISRHINN